MFKFTLRYFNFASGHNDTDDNAVPPNSATSRIGSPSRHRDGDKSGSLLHAKAVSGRSIVNHIWDAAEPHFLVCFTKLSSAAILDDSG